MLAVDSKALVRRRHLQCLVHRFAYYVLASPLVSDAEYDRMEADLIRLLAAEPALHKELLYPDMCASTHIGSSNPEDYPRHVEMIAKSLLAYKDIRKPASELEEFGPEVEFEQQSLF